MGGRSCCRRLPSLSARPGCRGRGRSTPAGCSASQGLLVRGGTGEVEDENGADCILEVAGYEAAVSLLSGCVPELQAAGGGVMGHVFAEKVDADGGLRVWGGTLSFSSKRLLTKR